MKLLQLAVFTGIVRALPQFTGSSGSINPKTGQPTGWPGFFETLDFSKSISNDVADGPCRDIFFIVGRGSMEPGNIGVTTGPRVCGLLKKKYGDKVGCQGVNATGYAAGIMDNVRPKGTTDASIAAGLKEFNDAYAKCPNSILVFEGYSQGAALMHNVIPALSRPIRKQIVGGILFGDTKNQQSGATIEGYPKEDLISICAEDDGVCWGRLSVTAGHMVYTQNGDVEKAADFLISKIDAALQRKSTAEAPQ